MTNPPRWLVIGNSVKGEIFPGTFAGLRARETPEAGESTIPFVVYEVFLTGAKEDKLFEYEERIGDEIAHFKDELKRLHERAFEARRRIQRQLEEVGIAVKEGRIESL